MADTPDPNAPPDFSKLISFAKEKSTGPTVYAHTLEREEWFALAQITGLAPSASLEKSIEAREMVVGMSRKQQEQLLRDGVEKLLARGLLERIENPDGTVSYAGRGRVVTQLMRASERKPF